MIIILQTDRNAVIFAKYKERRKKYIGRHDKVKRFHSSKAWHGILLPLLKLLRLLDKQSIHIIGDLHVNTTKPVIYACTHIGFYDIMILFEAIKKTCWLFWENPGEDLTTLFGWIAMKNGAILVDAYDKEDRKNAKTEAEMLLK